MIKQITSAANPLIKQVRALERKRERARSGLFLAEGARLVLEAEEAGIRPEILLFCAEALARPAVRALVARCDAAGVRCVETSERLLVQITRRENAQSLIAVYRQRQVPLASLDPRGHRLWVALQEVRDPGNLGTILRTADAVGAGGVILIGDCCDPFSLETVRASMGSIFAVGLAESGFEELRDWCRTGGARLVGTSLRASRRHDDLPPAAGSPTVLLMGNEQAGLPAEMEDGCDALVRLPMRGRADSLNLAVATAVMLYALWGTEDYAGAQA